MYYKNNNFLIIAFAKIFKKEVQKNDKN